MSDLSIRLHAYPHRIILYTVLNMNIYPLSLKKVLITLLSGAMLMTQMNSPAFALTDQAKAVNPTIETRAYTIESLPTADKIDVITYKMPYRNGNIQDTTALVFYPKSEMPKDGWRIVVWTHGTVGVGDACAPSNNTINTNFKVALDALLEEGYVVLAPDYEGLGTPGIHPYLNLESEALSVIYGVTALEASNADMFEGSWMVVGQSQGGQAALGTAEYANLDPQFKGTVAGAPASGLLEIIRDVAPKQLTELNASEAAQGIALEDRNAVQSLATILTYGALAGIGLKATYPDFDYLSLFYPSAREFAKSAEGTNGEDGLCLHPVRDLFKADLIKFMEENPDKPMLAYPGIDQEAFHNHPRLLEFFKANQPGTKRLDKPVLIIQGTEDTNVPAVVTKELVKNLKALGSSDIELILVEGASHTQAIIWKNDELVKFIKQYMPAK